MKDVFLIDIYIDHLILLFSIICNIILDRIYVMIDIMFFTIYITRKSAHTIIHDHNIGMEAVDQIIQRLQR